jgi:hypothetical protein
MKNRLDRDCVLLDGKCDCWIPMKECKYLPVNVNETEKSSKERYNPNFCDVTWTHEVPQILLK